MMSSKQMQRWSGIFLSLAVLALIYIVFFNSSKSGGAYTLLLMSAIFNASSSIMKKLESINIDK